MGLETQFEDFKGETCKKFDGHSKAIKELQDKAHADATKQPKTHVVGDASVASDFVPMNKRKVISVGELTRGYGEG